MAALFPFWNHGSWFVRGFDFPRLQIFIVNILLLVFAITSNSLGLAPIFYTLLIGILSICLYFDIYRIFPYTIFHTKESIDYTSEKILGSVSVITSNVFIFNSKYGKIIRLIAQEKPDLVLLLETDEKWERGCASLEETYPYCIKIPQTNGYGMLFYSKFPLKNTEIKYITDENVPSIFTDIVLNSKDSIHFIGLHPRPPRPTEGDSDQRDGELMKVADYIKSLKNRAVLVTGDLNDVAWSHTTRLFRRASGLLDPRVGRGMYNTFHVNYFFMRFPLDHFFHSKNLMITKMHRLPDINSDHFPLMAKFNLIHEFDVTQVPEESLPGDKAEIEEFKERGENWDGPYKEITPNDSPD